MLTFKKILVPIDFSPASKRAFELALGIASRFDSSIEILHAVEYPMFTMPDVSVTIPGTPPMALDTYAQEIADKEMDKLMRSMSADVTRAGVPVTHRVVRGNARAVILEIAEKGGFDLIVMGTHGRTGLDHMLLGSVAERVVRKASCSVLTTRESAS